MSIWEKCAMIAIQCIFKEVGFMQLYEAIELGLFTVLPAVILVLAFLLGLKRNIFQSAAKLICVILSVVVSAIVVKVSLPPVVPVLFDFLQGEISPEILNYLQTSSAVKDLLTFASALLMPVVFFFVFIVAWLVFAILYFIPGTILSKRSFARRAARKVAKQAVAVPACESVDQPENPVEIQEKKGVNWAKVGMKVGSVVLNVGAAFIGLAFFAMPISYYANLAYVSLDAMESASEVRMSVEIPADELKELKQIVAAINNHPMNAAYKSVNSTVSNNFDEFITQNGNSVNVTETVTNTVVLLETVSKIDLENLKAQDLFVLADQLKNNEFLDEVSSEILSDIGTAWSKGEDFMGIEPVEIINPEVSGAIYGAISKNGDASTLLQTAGNVIALQEVLNGSGNNTEGDNKPGDDTQQGGSSGDNTQQGGTSGDNTQQGGSAGDNVEEETPASKIMQILNNVDEATLALFTDLVSGEILQQVPGITPEIAEVGADLINSILTNIVELKAEYSKDPQQLEAVLKAEAEVLASIIQLSEDPENADIPAVIASVGKSKALINTVIDITKSGTVKDPFNLAVLLDDEAVDAVSNMAILAGFKADSLEYKCIMALVTKK